MSLIFNKLQDYKKNIYRKWNVHGLESLSVPGAVMDFSKDSQDVLLKTSDPTRQEQRLKFRKGQFFNPKMNRWLGVNGNSLLSLKESQGSMWTMSQVDVDATLDFQRLPPPSKPLHGSWPFDCQKLIPCKDVPYQTCGCDLTSDYEDNEKNEDEN